MSRLEPGIHLAHKPVGVTSFSVVQGLFDQVERGGKRLPFCHGGTLDPFAEGLLLLLVGPATRLMDLLHAVPKTYRTRIVWGTETDNGDLLGKPTLQGETAGLTPETLAAALEPFLGWQDQVPPPTSAKKIGGEPAYRKVHRGETVVLPPSRVYLHRARFVSHQLPHHSVLELSCRGGYYVRALARDLGRALGCGAHLDRLHRTQIGPWRDPGPGTLVGFHGPEVLPWCALRELSDQELGALRKGESILRGDVKPGRWPLPAGFPDPQVPIGGVHQGRLIAMLRTEAALLSTVIDLRRGV